MPLYKSLIYTWPLSELSSIHTNAILLCVLQNETTEGIFAIAIYWSAATKLLPVRQDNCTTVTKSFVFLSKRIKSWFDWRREESLTMRNVAISNCQQQYKYSNCRKGHQSKKDAANGYSEILYSGCTASSSLMQGSISQKSVHILKMC